MQCQMRGMSQSVRAMIPSRITACRKCLSATMPAHEPHRKCPQCTVSRKTARPVYQQGSACLPNVFRLRYWHLFMLIQRRENGLTLHHDRISGDVDIRLEADDCEGARLSNVTLWRSDAYGLNLPEFRSNELNVSATEPGSAGGPGLKDRGVCSTPMPGTMPFNVAPDFVVCESEFQNAGPAIPIHPLANVILSGPTKRKRRSNHCAATGYSGCCSADVAVSVVCLRLAPSTASRPRRWHFL